jgi:hypothetical protein
MIRQRIGVLAALVACLLAAGTPANAATTQVRGTQVTVDEAAGKYQMYGDLYGAWYVTIDPTSVRFHPPGTIQLRGSETFIGCLNANGNRSCDVGELSGTIDFSFVYTKSAGDNGRCRHPIVGATGGFSGATGQLTFKDRAGQCGEILTTYTGHISL